MTETRRERGETGKLKLKFLSFRARASRHSIIAFLRHQRERFGVRDGTEKHKRMKGKDVNDSSPPLLGPVYKEGWLP